MSDLEKPRSRTPRIFDQKGSIQVGKDADLVVLDENFDVVLTLCRGKIAYSR